MTETPLPDAPRKSVIDSIRPFVSRPALVMILLGFSSGLPLSLIFDTLQVWLRDVDLSLTTIAYFSLVTFVYSLKFVWAPVLDRVGLPGLTFMLGHRRGWILFSQAVIMAGLWVISGLNPQQHLGWMAVAAVIIGLAGATQDIVIDAWRIETAGAQSSNQAVMATAAAWGARIAPFVSGIVPLAIADTLGWGFAYALMAALMGLGIIGVLLAPRGPEHTVRPIEYGDAPARPVAELIEWIGRLVLMVVAICLLGAGLTANIELFKGLFPGEAAFEAANAVWTAKGFGIFVQFAAVIAGLSLLAVTCLPIPGALTRPGAYLRQTFVEPIASFFSRHERLAGLILATICLYRISDFLLNVNGAFYLDLGFDKLAIAEVRKIFGVVMTMIGVGLGGFSMTRFGIRPSLVLGAIVCGASNIAYAWLATQGNSIFAFSVALAVDNISAGIAGTVLIAYMSSLISTGGYVAQQYALFTSLYALPGKLLASQSGRMIETMAQGADHGGFAAGLKGLFAGLPAVSYEKPAATLGVSREALGSGYVVFFTYTAVIGFIAIVLSVWLTRLQKTQDMAQTKEAGA